MSKIEQLTGELYYLTKSVQQTSGIKQLIGREGIVIDTLVDEKGALHCLVESPQYGVWWCPAQVLKVIEG